jgi:glycosyltransferase involved in cell wall biosynthesis
MVLVHETPQAPGSGPFDRLIGRSGIDVRVLRGMPTINDPIPEPRPEMPLYLSAVHDLHDATGRPVIAIPTLSAECVGLMAAVAQRLPAGIRALGWMHNDIPYDRLTFQHYEPLLHRFVAVSRDIASSLGAALPSRSGDVRLIHYGVPVPEAPIERHRKNLGTPARPLRLVYAGRMDSEQKRVHALIDASRSLESMEIAHELLLIGDGPASGRIDALIAGRPRIRRVTPTARAKAGAITHHLDRADCFVLASRYEGLSIAMLEAMARGCVPVVTRVSGALDAVTPPGEAPCGVVVETPPGVDDPGVGPALAQGIQHALTLGLPSLSHAAHRRARERFSLDSMCDAASALADEVAHDPPRAWPADRPAVAGDFTVPPDAAERLRRALASLQGRTVALWGAGRHTRRVAADAHHTADAIVAVLDDYDDAAPRTIGPWPIARADQLRALGVTDVLISTALHEPMLWARRGELERLGLRVHRLYAA